MKIKTTPEKVNEAIRKLQQVSSVSFDGTNGRFSAKGVAGRFKWDGNGIITIVIDDKPWLASEEMIESEIKKFFA